MAPESEVAGDLSEDAPFVRTKRLSDLQEFDCPDFSSAERIKTTGLPAPRKHCLVSIER